MRARLTAACVLSAVAVAMQPLGNATTNLAITSSSVETTAYTYTGGPGVITLVFVESADFLWPAYDSMRLRVYVDDDAQGIASVDVPMGFFDEGDLSPWGQAALGNTGSAGAEYISYPIPFASSVRVAFLLGSGDIGPHHVNVLIRGRSLSAPPTTRTKTLCPSTATYNAGSTVTLFNTSAIAPAPAPAGVAAGGQLTLLGLSVAGSNNMTYLNGEVTMCADGACVPASYGLESFFLAEQGLQLGKYTTVHAGITAVAPLLGHSALLWRDLSVANDGYFSQQLSLLWTLPPLSGQVTVAPCGWVRLGVTPPPL